ncbi:uncharacterized protein RHOBADRAFT_51993, partial [Rhodotorula graminis WP1]
FSLRRNQPTPTRRPHLTPSSTPAAADLVRLHASHWELLPFLDHLPAGSSAIWADPLLA